MTHRRNWCGARLAYLIEARGRIVSIRLIAKSDCKFWDTPVFPHHVLVRSRHGTQTKLTSRPNSVQRVAAIWNNTQNSIRIAQGDVHDY
jgi:hypothetical protein